MKESKSSPQQKKLNVLLVGDSCIDRYIYGTCDRLNPEAPVPILKQSKDIKISKGMAYNVKDNLKSLGVDVSIRTGGKPCIKTRYVDTRSGQQVLRVDEDFISPKLNVSRLQLASYDAVVVSDYNKGFITSQVISDIIKLAKHKPVFVDTKLKDLCLIDSPNLFVKINELEFSQITSQCTNLIITQGSKGARFKGRNFTLHKEVDVADVCGAGDTFIAALTVKYLETKDILKAIDFANAAASISVQHEGIYAPLRHEVDQLYNSYYNKD